MTDQIAQYTVADMLRVMERLRDPEHGCPWDVQQNYQSIASSTIEEAYELVDALERNDLDHAAEELGDLLFQVIFYSQLGSEEDRFDFSVVVDTLVRKLIRRHPHVFANGELEGVVDQTVTTEAVKAQWEAIKAEERAGKAQHGILADVPIGLPALSRAQKLQKRASQVGFDWTEVSAVIENLESEIAELKLALSQGNVDHIADEFGDVLFSAVNVGRHLKLDAEASLRRSSAKFERRFSAVEQQAKNEGSSLQTETPEQMERRWQDVKKTEVGL